MKKNPNRYSIGIRSHGLPDHSVAIHANTWIPIGIATAMLAALKNASASSGIPTVYMWCTHSPKLRNPTDTNASTIQV